MSSADASDIYLLILMGACMLPIVVVSVGGSAWVAIRLVGLVVAELKLFDVRVVKSKAERWHSE